MYRQAQFPTRVQGRTQGYLAHKKQPPFLGPPQGPRHIPAVGSWVGAVSDEQGNPVPLDFYPCTGVLQGEFIRTSIYDKYSVSTKISTCPDHIRHCKTSGTNWSNKPTGYSS